MPIDTSKYLTGGSSPSPSVPSPSTSKKSKINLDSYLPGGGMDAQQLATNNALGRSQADEQWQVAHQWDNNPEAQAIINPPEKSIMQKSGSFNQPDESGNLRTDYPGGWLNPLNDLNRLSNSPALRTFDHAAGQSLGVPEDMMLPAKSTGSSLVDNTLGFLGGSAGFMVNPAMPVGNLSPVSNFFENPKIQQIANAAGNKMQGLLPDAGMALSRDGSQIIDSMLGRTVNKATQGAIQGGLGAASYAPFQTLSSGQDIQDIPRNMLEQGLGGFALGGALGGLSPTISKGWEALKGLKPNVSPLDASVYEQGLPQRPNLGSIPSPEADKFNFIDNRANVYQDAPLALQEPIAVRKYKEALARNSSPEYGSNPIAGQGDIHIPEPLGLPEGNYTPQQRLKINNNENAFNSVAPKIFEKATERMTPPLENPNELAKWVQGHFNDAGHQVSLNEVRALSYEDLRQLSQEIKSKLNVSDIVRKTAHDMGYGKVYDLTTPSVKDRIVQDTHNSVYGIQPKKVNIARPDSFNVSKTEQAFPTKSRLGYSAYEPIKGPVKASKKPLVQNNEIVKPIPKEVSGSTKEQTGTIQSTPLRSQKLQGSVDNLKFTQTVTGSQHTAPELVSALNERPAVGARTTDVLNRKQAKDLIDKHGTEGLYGKLMGKKLNFSPSETTAAQMLAKHYSSIGGEENLSKAIDLVSKTAKGGREMGQAIQALSQWNKLDAEGALLVAERQLNKGVKDTADWQKLTVAQATPIKEAAQRIGTAQETKSLADEVLNIVTNKKSGEALTDAEKTTIKQFQDQVKQINEKTNPFLLSDSPKGNKADATIKEVSQIEPKERTRDQVVSFLDAKAKKARQRIAASRNIGFAAVNKGNPVIDWSIIGASHIARGIVKLSDFTEQMVKDFGESIKPHIDEVFTKATNMFRKENGLPTVEELDRVVNNAVKDARFSPQDANRFKAWASEIGHMSEDFKMEATQDLQKAMKELGDSTLGQKLATLQTGAQLLNAVTIGRNVIGNTALIAAEKVSKLAAVPIDFAFSKLTGERTIQWLPHNQEVMHRNFMKGTGGGWEGVSPTGTLESYGIHPNVFGKNNPLKYISKSLGASMQGFDFAAYRLAYGDVLATYGEQLGKAQGLSKAQIKEQMPKLIESLDSRIHDMADEAGRYATFQDDTLLSQGAEMLKRGLNKITDFPMQKLVEKGMPKKYSLEGFGTGDIVLKYAKTPANLVMRALDYSPIGMVRAVMELAPLAYNRSKFNQFQATRALSRSITGSLGLTGMGYILADAGVLTGSSSMDKDTRSIQEQSGQGAYKVNWSALSRFFTSGFDKSAAQYQKGDKLMDYAWLQPAAISVAMGVNANKAVNDRKHGNETDGWQIAQKAILGGLQTVLENPMVQGVSSVIDATSDIVKKQDPTKLRNIGKGAPATFVPTVLNQLRTATDNSQRETFSKDLLTEMGNLMINKVPGLSKSLPVSYDSLGNAREKIQGGQENTVAQYLTAFFSPAKMTEYQVSPEAKLVLDLMNQSGDQNVLPRIADKYIKVSQGKNAKDLRVDLTSKEFSQLQQSVGQMVTEKLASQSSYLSDPNRSMQGKVDKIKAILSDTGKKARDELGTQMGFKKKDIR